MNTVNKTKMDIMPFSSEKKYDKPKIVCAESKNRLEHDMEMRAVLGKSGINFRGGKFKLNPNDRLFISSIAATFGLAAAVKDKIKDVVSDYLKTNNYQSMSDIGGEENIEQQCDLTDKINEVLKLNDSDSEWLAHKVLERCDAGENYYPSENDDIDYKESIKMSELIRNSIAKFQSNKQKNDERFINTLCRVFKLSGKQQAKLYKIIYDILDKNNLKNLQDINTDDIEITANLIEQIEEEFDITIVGSTLISMEIMHLLYSGNNYEPEMTTLDLDIENSNKDAKIYFDVIKNYNVSKAAEHKLLVAMKHDAENNNYSSICQLFTNKNNAKQMPETNKVLFAIMTQDDKCNFLIDMNSAAQNRDSITVDTDEDSSKQAQKNYAVICLLDDEFNLSVDNIKKIERYLRDSKVNYQDKKSISKTAYELTENKILPPEKFKKITEILEQADYLIEQDAELPEEEQPNYAFEYCQKIINKKSNRQ